MPIQGRPLLEYWLSTLYCSGIKNVLVNTHYHADIVHEFLQRSYFKEWVCTVAEKRLLGTAGTIKNNINYFLDKTTLLIHADNLCCCNFLEFLEFHDNTRPNGTVMTMMTFKSSSPESCGIVELDDLGVVVKFHEKISNPPGNLANAAVYLLEPEVIEWINNHPEITDFSTEVLPHFIGKIATWNNIGVLRDIGTIEMLREAQTDDCEQPIWKQDEWLRQFNNNPIHVKITPNT